MNTQRYLPVDVIGMTTLERPSERSVLVRFVSSSAAADFLSQVEVAARSQAQWRRAKIPAVLRDVTVEAASAQPTRSLETSSSGGPQRVSKPTSANKRDQYPTSVPSTRAGR